MKRSNALRVVDADWEEVSPPLPSHANRVQRHDPLHDLVALVQTGRSVRVRRRASDGELMEVQIGPERRPTKRRGDLGLVSEVCNKVLLLVIVVPISLIMIGVAFRLMGVV